MTIDVLDTIKSMRSEADEKRERNRRKFPEAAETLDMVREFFPNAKILWARNAQGEEIGKRDDGPWVSGPWNHMRVEA